MTQAEYWATVADWQVAYVECARAHGADAEILNGNSIQNPVAEGRPVEGGLDAECVAEVGATPVAPPASEALLIGLYELHLVQADCLEAEGYAISDPPSREAWVENYGGGSWDPLVDVQQVEGTVMVGLELCGQPDPVEAERRGFEILGTQG